MRDLKKCLQTFFVSFLRRCRITWSLVINEKVRPRHGTRNKTCLNPLEGNNNNYHQKRKNTHTHTTLNRRRRRKLKFQADTQIETKMTLIFWETHSNEQNRNKTETDNGKRKVRQRIRAAGNRTTTRKMHNSFGNYKSNSPVSSFHQH